MHIAIRYLIIKAKMGERENDVECKPTLQMLAGMFTAPLQKELFRVMCTKVLLYYVMYCMDGVKI